MCSRYYMFDRTKNTPHAANKTIFWTRRYIMKLTYMMSLESRWNFGEFWGKTRVGGETIPQGCRAVPSEQLCLIIFSLSALVAYPFIRSLVFRRIPSLDPAGFLNSWVFISKKAPKIPPLDPDSGSPPSFASASEERGRQVHTVWLSPVFSHSSLFSAKYEVPLGNFTQVQVSPVHQRRREARRGEH